MIPIVTWSTHAVPRTQRLDYFADALSSAIVPMRVEPTRRASLTSEMAMLDVEGIVLLAQRGSPHRSVRGRAEIARSGAHTFHLIVNRRTHWHVEHLGKTRVAPGQAFMIDSHVANVIEMPLDYDVIHVMLPEVWVRRWLPDPALLVGRALGGDTANARALAAFTASLSPSAVQGAPLFAVQMLDHFGAMLALSAGTSTLGKTAPTAALHTRIVGCMANRCTEPTLAARDIASALDIDEAELHRALASKEQTFAGLLVGHRTAAARRMLASRAFEGLSFEEIARRAGFPGAASLCALLHLR